MGQMIAFYSRAGENYVSGAIQDLPVGNTEVAAGILAELTGARLFKIEQIAEYPWDYSACIEEARRDQNRDARPELKAYPDGLEDYETIYLGYPNYWGTMPMAVFTFLEKFDFSGKIVKPFCTHEGSGMGKSEADIRRLCPGATVERGIAIQGARVKHARSELERWVLR